ncbi:hypothetical protein [Hyphococcus luteus]|uniref:Uncharacterized protein n=1 Tax=Hyphococcus luteus TaxID=2058213 RepID=A0A2S7K900_9PROT|nr:hypothetical protein [Marinicaulis flavus]PQA88929.1 hypothetical protein CW354_02975 [Marinicaulis flavus]
MKHLLTALCAAIAAASSFAFANDAASNTACETASLSTKADVTTSAGSSYKVETYYRTPGEAAARFITDKPALMAVEGPLVWVRSAEGDMLAGENERRFVIGHQFHALAFYFDDIMSDVTAIKGIDFKDGNYKGRKGVYPGGGEATLAIGKNKRPLGLLLELPDETRIEVAYEDWRETPSGKTAPYAVTISHNGTIFNYRYTEVTFATGGAAAFQEAYPAPTIGAVADYRAARAKEAAACDSGADD